jgi:tellurite resistance protein TerC
LLLTLILIEISDVIFALDSIPAIFAVTQDAFIVFTSNIFAILGLRALYFLLENMAEKLHLLKYGVAIILIFIGAKMLIAPWFTFSSSMALTVVAVVLLTTAALSYVVKDKREK